MGCETASAGKDSSAGRNLEPPWIARAGNREALGKMDLPTHRPEAGPPPPGQAILAPQDADWTGFAQAVSRHPGPCCPAGLAASKMGWRGWTLPRVCDKKRGV